jgi:hypothetical protein
MGMPVRAAHIITSAINDLLQKCDPVVSQESRADMSLVTCAIFQSPCPVLQNRLVPAESTTQPEIPATLAWLAQTRSNSTVNYNAAHVRQIHRPVASTAINALLQFYPKHPIFTVAPVTTPKVIVFVKFDFHRFNTPLVFLSVYTISITNVWRSGKYYVNFSDALSRRG